MSGKVVASVAVAAVVIVAAMVGVGYAMYQGSSSSVGVDSDTVLTASVDIYTSSGNGYSPLSSVLSVPAYEQGQEVTIDGYYLMVTGNQGQNSSVRLWCDMEYTQSWVFIDRMYLTFDGSDTEYDFGVRAISEVRTTGVPTDAITDLVADVHYGFTIHIVYSNVDPSFDAQGEKYASFEGSAFIFAFDGTDPLGQ